MKRSIFKKDKKYTFSDYFELNNPTKEILQEFGYEYNFAELDLPKLENQNFSLNRLRETYLRKLPLISLNSEAAKREFYISPLLLEILDYVNAEINVEYPLYAEDNLSGTIDYLVESHRSVIILEAKKGDLERGFNQLSVELIALDKIWDGNVDLLYGAVTLGDIWRFGMLERKSKKLSKDMNAYILPADLESLLAIFLGIIN